MSEINSPSTVLEIERWLIGRVSNYGNVDSASITTIMPLAELGLDSVYALALCGDIEDELGIEVDPTIAWDYPTINELARALSQRTGS